MAAVKFVFLILWIVYITKGSSFNIYPQDQTSQIKLLDNEDGFSGTSYRLHKRSTSDVLVPKKATASMEKKPVSKADSLDPKAFPKESKHDLKYKIENETAQVNVTEAHSNLTATANATTVLTESTSANSIPLSNSTLTVATPNTTAVPSSSSTSAPSSPSPVPSSSTAFPDDVLPTRPSNISNTTIDYHTYYNSTIFLKAEMAMAYWVNFDTLPQDKVIVHRMLSDSHRKAATVTLTFDFPFYGHPLRNITIATGGFVYMGDYMHSWLAATQYIAPLMANFDTSLSSLSTVRYFDNGTAFVIEWHSVTLQDEKRGGNFTFQATLLNNGNIIFVYHTIPVSVTEIGDNAHPVKVGLSDAYVIDRIIYFIRRKTIYEYHRIDMKRGEIGNKTAIYFTALTTCMSYRDCNSCMSATGMECVWCQAANRCSDGLDRLRQDWLQSKCDIQRDSVNCSLLPSPDVNPFVQPLTDSPFIRPFTYSPQTPKSNSAFETSTNEYFNQDNGASSSARVAQESSSLGVGGVVAVLLILSMVVGGLLWVGYAYKNPHSSSGQLLIRYRPSQWRFGGTSARYTAASVHM